MNAIYDDIEELFDNAGINNFEKLPADSSVCGQFAKLFKKLFKNLNDRLSCNNFGLGGLAVVLDEFNRRAMAVVMSSF